MTRCALQTRVQLCAVALWRYACSARVLHCRSSHTWPLNPLICILSCGAVLQCVLHLCVTLSSLLMLENTLFRPWQFDSFFYRVFVKLYLSGFSYRSVHSLCFCLVPPVLSFSPQKQKWFLGSFFQLFYCFLVRHHDISKEQRSLKSDMKWQNGCVDRILVFLCKPRVHISATPLRRA